MEPCPYCGEDLKPNAKRCPRCGTTLVEDGGDADLDLALGDEEDVPVNERAAAVDAAAVDEARKKKKKLVPCPHCEHPISEKAHRCPECGRAIRALVSDEERATERKWKLGGLAALGAGAVVLALVLLVIGFIFRTGGGDGKREEEIVKVSFGELEGLFGPASKTPESRREERWDELEGKYVVLEATVVDRSGSTLYLRHNKSAGDADARLELRDEEEKKDGLSKGAKIKYKARLEGRGGRYVVDFADGEVITVRGK
jgi:ssDNA-binding Zn-finger/Zn-ribbon topoisomerase 1